MLLYSNQIIFQGVSVTHVVVHNTMCRMTMYVTTGRVKADCGPWVDNGVAVTTNGTPTCKRCQRTLEKWRKRCQVYPSATTTTSNRRASGTGTPEETGC